MQPRQMAHWPSPLQACGPLFAGMPLHSFFDALLKTEATTPFTSSSLSRAALQAESSALIAISGTKYCMGIFQCFWDEA